MKFAEKNDNSIELHLTFEERELLFNTLRYYSSYVKPDSYFIEHIGKICEILNVLHLPEFDKRHLEDKSVRTGVVNGRIDALKSETNYERIRNRTIDEVVEYIYSRDDVLLDEICKFAYNECPFGENVEPDNCKNCIKCWLEKEVAE